MKTVTPRHFFTKYLSRLIFQDLPFIMYCIYRTVYLSIYLPIYLSIYLSRIDLIELLNMPPLTQKPVLWNSFAIRWICSFHIHILPLQRWKEFLTQSTEGGLFETESDQSRKRLTESYRTSFNMYIKIET